MTYLNNSPRGLQQIGQLSPPGLQIRVAADMLLAHEDVGHASLRRDLLQSVLYIAAVVWTTVSPYTNLCAWWTKRPGGGGKKRTELIQFDSLKHSPELVQKFFAGCAVRAPRLGENDLAAG